MSAQTLQDLEDAIMAHHRDITAEDGPERAGSIVTAWVVGYEISNIVDLGLENGGNVIGFANDYTTSDSSPNLLAHLAAWTSAAIDETINGADLDDD